jgi:hypothetical protein
MKTIVGLIFFLVTADVFAQSQLPPLYYLNGEEIDMENVHVNPSSISDIKVVKDTERGAIYMTTKRRLTFLTLDMILRTNTEIRDSASQIIYIVNDNLVNDTSKVKVDASYFVEIEIKRLDRLTYIDEVHKNLTLVEIHLLKDKPKPAIRIRGDEGPQTRD